MTIEVRQQKSLESKTRTVKPFKYTKCVHVLQKIPEFDPTVPRSSDNTSATSDSPCDVLLDPDTTAIASVMLLLSRVQYHQQAERKLITVDQHRVVTWQDRLEWRKNVGKDKAKQQQPINLPTKTSGMENLILAYMSTVTKDLVAAFKAKISIKRSDLNARKPNKWMRMADMYMATGEGALHSVLSPRRGRIYQFLVPQPTLTYRQKLTLNWQQLAIVIHQDKRAVVMIAIMVLKQNLKLRRMQWRTLWNRSKEAVPPWHTIKLVSKAIPSTKANK